MTKTNPKQYASACYCAAFDNFIENPGEKGRMLPGLYELLRYDDARNDAILNELEASRFEVMEFEA